MDFKELADISESEEREHWWTQTRFLYIVNAIEQLLQLTKTFRVVEFGCGTAQNLWYVRNRSPFREHVEYLIGVDPFLPETFAPEWLTASDRLTNRLDSGATADLILGLDVLEHIEDDESALREWSSHLNCDGIMLLSVPAFSFLWSQHDIVLGHKRRYTKFELLRLTTRVGLEPVSLKYIFSFAFPLLFARRKLTRRNGKRATDLTPTPKPINFVLKVLGRVESHLGGFPFFGTSIIAVFRKRPGQNSSGIKAYGSG
jgi:SAM-dependent methyltransferase